jgi:hypothetical protein
METYKFNFNVNYMRCDNFKQNHTYIIRNIIEKSRLGYSINFHGYGNTTFDKNDTKLQEPTVEIINEFNRNKTNCLCYNIIDPKYSNIYDKLFIFQYIGKNDSYYGFVLYNTETGKYSHKYCINYDDSDLCIAITKGFHTLDFDIKNNNILSNCNKNIKL